MALEFYIMKYKYYSSWYNELAAIERSSLVGMWIVANMNMYLEVIRRKCDSIGRVHRPIGNYPLKFSGNEGD